MIKHSLILRLGAFIGVITGLLLQYIGGNIYLSVLLGVFFVFGLSFIDYLFEKKYPKEYRA